MSSTLACPHCKSTTIIAKHTARKVGAGIGAAAGFGAAMSSAVTGAASGATFAVHHFSDKSPSPQTVLSALIGGLIGGVTGCAAGATFGDALDQNIFDNYTCLNCDQTFSFFHSNTH